MVSSTSFASWAHQAWFPSEGFRNLRGSSHFEGMRKEPREKEPRALGWILPGLRGHSCLSSGVARTCGWVGERRVLGL